MEATKNTYHGRFLMHLAGCLVGGVLALGSAPQGRPLWYILAAFLGTYFVYLALEWPRTHPEVRLAGLYLVMTFLCLAAGLYPMKHFGEVGAWSVLLLFVAVTKWTDT